MSELESIRTRINMIKNSPNPLFEKWLKEFIVEAERKDAKSQFQLKKALVSLQKFPLSLNTGRDCIILEGFGKGICALLDQKLEKYIKKNMTTDVSNIQNIVQLSETFHESDSYKKQQEKKQRALLEEVTKNVVKSGIVPMLKKGCKATKKTIDEKPFESFTMKPETFDIILLVDTQETTGKSKTHLDRTIQELNRYNVNFEVRRLSVGDFLWIAKDKLGRELVLPYIVERKRKDDLASSIKDGRYYEQKYRLKNCGLKNIIYLIENIENCNDKRLGMPEKNLVQASVNTRIQNDFNVKITENNPHSMMYLHTVTSFLKRFYKEKHLISCSKENLYNSNECNFLENLMTFEEFNKSSTKKGIPSIKEIFVKQLLQLKGLSVDKAIAITDVYSTPMMLISAYKSCLTVKDGENLLSNIIYGHLKKPVGPTISKSIYYLYKNEDTS